MSAEVTLKTNPRSLAAVNRRTTSQDAVFDNIPAGVATVLSARQAANVEPVGPPSTTFHQIPEAGVEGDIAMWLPIAAPTETGDGVEVVSIAEQTVAALVHEGSYATLAETYTAITNWVHDHGHTVSGPPTETYLNSPGEVSEAELRTEVAFPIDAV